jgi:hypothetical protein
MNGATVNPSPLSAYVADARQADIARHAREAQRLSAPEAAEKPARGAERPFPLAGHRMPGRITAS